MDGRTRQLEARAGNRARWLIAVGVIGVCSVLQGCAFANNAQSLVDPTQASLPSWVDVPTVIAAGERALLARGYVIVRDNATASEGEVLGTAAENPTTLGPARHVLITARAAKGGTLVRVSHLPGHSRHHASLVLNDLREQLGLR